MKQTSSLLFHSGRAYCEILSRVIAETMVTDRNGSLLEFDTGVNRVVVELLELRRTPHKAILIGNGGSAAIASHLQCDLCNSVGVKAITFHGTPFYSAIANDHGVEAVFEKPIELFADDGDLLIAVSSSGRSKNILRGVLAARRKGCLVVTLSGFKSDNALRTNGDLNFYLSSDHYGIVETGHQVLVHCFTDLAAEKGSGKSDE